MPLEIERKFLVVDDSWRQAVVRTRSLRQGYLTKNGRLSIRVRIDGTEEATLTIKTASVGITRNEFEYSIPVADAEQLLDQREGAIVGKIRHIVMRGGDVWEIDVFDGENQGLVIAEIELTDADQRFERPSWLGEEVTQNRRYFNADLSRLPFSQW